MSPDPKDGEPQPAVSMPSGREYAEAMQNPSLCFNRPSLQTASFESTPIGVPKLISGNNAVVFFVDEG
ncbi:hypothetical protein GCM10020001_055970 [Nonomuraea salmonea]